MTATGPMPVPHPDEPGAREPPTGPHKGPDPASPARRRERTAVMLLCLHHGVNHARRDTRTHEGWGRFL